MVSKGQGANKVNVKEGGKVREEVMKNKYLKRMVCGDGSVVNEVTHRVLWVLLGKWRREKAISREMRTAQYEKAVILYLFIYYTMP